MSLKVLKEVTDWDLDFQPNHTYLVDGDKCLAYKPHHGTEIRETTIKLHRSRRKFETFEYFEQDWPGITINRNTNTVEIKGSKGDVYTVNLDDETCTCPAFKFRGGCKHVSMAMVK